MNHTTKLKKSLESILATHHNIQSNKILTMRFIDHQIKTLKVILQDIDPIDTQTSEAYEIRDINQNPPLHVLEELQLRRYQFIDGNTALPNKMAPNFLDHKYKIYRVLCILGNLLDLNKQYRLQQQSTGNASIFHQHADNEETEPYTTSGFESPTSGG